MIAYRPQARPVLLERVPIERVANLFFAARPCVDRARRIADYPRLEFVMDGVLEGGVNSGLNPDTHGKSNSFLLLGMEIDVPRALVDSDHSKVSVRSETFKLIEMIDLLGMVRARGSARADPMRLKAEESEFVDKLGQIVQADGLSRVAGQVLGLMVVTEEPLTADRIAQLLQVSRGTVSINVRLLESLYIAERYSVPADRRDYFRLRESPYASLVEGQVKRLNAAAASMGKSARKIESRTARRRIQELKKFYETAATAYSAIEPKLRGKSG